MEFQNGGGWVWEGVGGLNLRWSAWEWMLIASHSRVIDPFHDMDDRLLIVYYQCYSMV